MPGRGAGGQPARLVLIDTVDQLPGLLPIHGWSALMTSDLVLVQLADHPFVPHLEFAELRHEVVPDSDEREKWIVARAQSEGEVAYLFGPADEEGFTRTLGLEAARAGVEVEVVYFMLAPRGVELLDLVRIVERLRGSSGCPWDREQTPATLAPYAVEEVYELLDAIASGDSTAIREELGDVLFQVVFQAQVAEDTGDFSIDDVAKAITAKLVRRHPHVFGDVEAADVQQVLESWERLKAAEKPERASIFEGIPAALPALQLADTVQVRAERAGLALGDDDADRARAELERFLAACAGEREAALGDLLAVVVAQARRHGLHAEQALRAAVSRFRSRVEAEQRG
ncbi:MAG: nucleoside triphosphate pyrophosphohydrolase [Egibacteraceae bacterium]